MCEVIIVSNPTAIVVVLSCIEVVVGVLTTCPYWTKTCPHWTCFGPNYPENWVGLAVNVDKNFNFSKVLLSPKFKYNSMSMVVKKKNFYYTFNLTLVNFPFQSMVNDVVENFFSSPL